jgi:hypothetical protein
MDEATQLWSHLYLIAHTLICNSKKVLKETVVGDGSEELGITKRTLHQEHPLAALSRILHRKNFFWVMIAYSLLFYQSSASRD